jgi:hypothetical protein
MGDVAGLAAHIAARCPSGATREEIAAWGNAPAPPRPDVPDPGPAAPAMVPAPAAQAAPGTASAAGDPADPSVPAAPAGAPFSPAARQLFERDDTVDTKRTFFRRQGCRPCGADDGKLTLKTCVHCAGAGQGCLSCSVHTRTNRREYLFEQRLDHGAVDAGAARAASMINIWTITSSLNLGSLLAPFSAAMGAIASSDHVTTALLHQAASKGISPEDAYFCLSCAAPYRHDTRAISLAKTLASHFTGSWLVWIGFRLVSLLAAHARS